MQVRLEIQRRGPEPDARPYWATYDLDAEPSDRVLDLLHRVKWEVDGSLTFRRSCGHGICGSDAMRINGTNRLACKVLVKDVAPRIRVQPLGAFPVLKDLVVDMEGFFDSYAAVEPYLLPQDATPPTRERLQSPEERAAFDDSTKCILCAACTSSCPVFWTNGRYIGPAAIVAAHRFVFDSRDAHPERHLAAMDGADGVWRCRKAYNCTDTCPRGIKITQHIIEIQRSIASRRA